jgi:hypothetical protein
MSDVENECEKYVCDNNKCVFITNKKSELRYQLNENDHNNNENENKNDHNNNKNNNSFQLENGTKMDINDFFRLIQHNMKYNNNIENDNDNDNDNNSEDDSENDNENLNDNNESENDNNESNDNNSHIERLLDDIIHDNYHDQYYDSIDNYKIFLWTDFMPSENSGGYAMAIGHNKAEAIEHLIHRFFTTRDQEMKIQRFGKNYRGKYPVASFGSNDLYDNELYAEYVAELESKKCFIFPCKNFSTFFAG